MILFGKWKFVVPCGHWLGWDLIAYFPMKNQERRTDIQNVCVQRLIFTMLGYLSVPEVVSVLVKFKTEDIKECFGIDYLAGARKTLNW